MALPVTASAILAANPLDSNPSLTSPNAALEASWAAWQARCAAHEVAVARRMRIALPIFVVLLAITLFVMFGR